VRGEWGGGDPIYLTCRINMVCPSLQSRVQRLNFFRYIVYAYHALCLRCVRGGKIRGRKGGLGCKREKITIKFECRRF
jgi:hypothetical protein